MFQRMIFERMETRILVGTIAVLGIMAITGWLAINEGPRMASFEQEFLARSIERGGMLFAGNCSTCHGPDGRGLTGVAPALNNPQFFGFNYFAEIDATIEQLEAEFNADATTAARRAEIEAELAELVVQRDQLVNQLQPATDVGYDIDEPSRLNQLGWAGSSYAFVYTTLVHGRPTSGAYWPQPMPAWSQTAGGPLRDDQLADLTNYVLNWDKGSEWTIEDLLAVNQFAKVPTEGGAVVVEGDAPVGADADITVLAAAIEAEPGDPVNGQQLYAGQLGCAGCHVAGQIAPATAGTWTRVQEIRLQQPELEGLTGVEYLVESIIHPNDYIVPGFAPAMPTNFGDRLTESQLADLVAYLMTQDEAIE